MATKRHRRRRPFRPGPPSGSNWNPFRTPGIAPEDQSVFSPGGQFDSEYRAIQTTRFALWKYPRARLAIQVFFALFIVAALAKAIFGY